MRRKKCYVLKSLIKKKLIDTTYIYFCYGVASNFAYYKTRFIKVSLNLELINEIELLK